MYSEDCVDQGGHFLWMDYVRNYFFHNIIINLRAKQVMVPRFNMRCGPVVSP